MTDMSKNVKQIKTSFFNKQNLSPSTNIVKFRISARLASFRPKRRYAKYPVKLALKQKKGGIFTSPP